MTATAPPPSVADDRDNAATRKLLTWFRPATGAWKTPTGEAWMPAVTLDSILNTYERTRDVTYLNVLEKSFARYEGRRSKYFDDDGWYLNAWLRAYDVTADPKYLVEAQALFAVLAAEWHPHCGGGVWWNSKRDYKNAITNELFLLAAARLHRRSPNGSATGSYAEWMHREWDWLSASGMIDAVGFVADGLDNRTCASNGGVTWTYNQGVILGALVELWRSTGEVGLLTQARRIADATIDSQVHPGGALREPSETWPKGCTGDAHIFKGMFAQGLARLYDADRAARPDHLAFLTRNADSVWTTARTADDGLGLSWAGPPGTPNEGTHAAATLLLSSVALLGVGGETCTPPPTGGEFLDAADAVRTGITLESAHAGHTGDGYAAAWRGDGQRVTFAVPSPTARTAVCSFRYAAGAGDAVRSIAVNDGLVARRLLFCGTRAWSSYRTVSVSVPLQAGDNAVTLAYESAHASTNWLNLDGVLVR